MRLMIALLVIGLAASPSLAQKMLDSKSKKSEQSGPPRKSAEDKDYKAAVERLPDQKFDPWRNMAARAEKEARRAAPRPPSYRPISISL